MKEWLRILPFPLLIFSVLTFLDLSTQPDNINWVYNIGFAVLMTAIGCTGQYLIHKNIIQDDDDDSDSCDGCCNCGRPE